MTEQEIRDIRKTLIDQYPPRKAFEDYLEFAFRIIVLTSITYFGAHILYYLINN